MEEHILESIYNNFDFSFILVVNIMTYTVIKIIDSLNGKKKVSKTIKRISLVASTVILYVLYIINGYEDKMILLNSAICAPIVWSWILKPLCNKLNIGYRDKDEGDTKEIINE